MRKFVRRAHKPASLVAAGTLCVHGANGAFHFLDFVASWRVVWEVASGLQGLGLVASSALVVLGGASAALWLRKDARERRARGAK